MHQKERKKEKNEQEQETDKSNQRPMPSRPLVSHIYHRIKVETRGKKKIKKQEEKTSLALSFPLFFTRATNSVQTALRRIGPGEMANRNFMRIRYSRRNNQFAESFPVIVRRGQRRQRNRQKDETGGEEGGGEGRRERKAFRAQWRFKNVSLAWPH